MARRKRRVKRNAGMGSMLLPLAVIGGGAAWLGYRKYLEWASFLTEKRNGRKIRISRGHEHKYDTNIPPNLVIDVETGKEFKTFEAFDAWAKNIAAVEALKKKLSTPIPGSLLGLDAFSMPQDPTVVELNQDPMIYDTAARRMKSSQRPKADSFRSAKPEVIPGVPITKERTSLPNLGRLSLVMQSVIMREVQTDATMVPYVKALLSGKNPEAAVYQALRKAMENQLDPKKYPETAGRWLLARKYFMKRRMSASLSGLGEEQKFYMATPSGYKEVAQKTAEEVAKMTKTTKTSSSTSSSSLSDILKSLTGSLVDVAKPALETMLQKNLKSVAKQAQAAVMPTVTKEDTDAKATELADKEMERLAKEEASKVNQQAGEAGGIGGVPAALVVVPLAAAAIPVLFGKKH